MLDVFEIGRTNRDLTQTTFDELLLALRGNDGNLVSDFAKWVEAEALIAINTKLFVITELINGRQYQNTYQWAEEQSRLSGRAVEDLLRERLGEYYERRISFDQEFENGQSFRYGALNAGGAGVTHYDPYCVVLSRAFQSSLEQTVCMPGDSLELCFLDDNSFTIARVRDRIVARDQWHLLVAKERANEIPHVDKEEWPILVASSNRYFEVIFIGEITLDSLESVRVSQDEYMAKWDLAFRNLGTKRSEAERALVHEFIQLRRAEVEGRVKVEVLT